MSFKELPAESRPREKTHRPRPRRARPTPNCSPCCCAPAPPGEDVLQLAQELLGVFDGLAGLLHAGSATSSGQGPWRHRQARRTGGGARTGPPRARRAAEGGAGVRLARSVKDYLQLHLARVPHEVFAALFLDAQHRLIAMEELFRGTLTQTSVYPREVVTRAMRLAAPRRRGGAGPQPPERARGALARRRDAHPNAQGRAGAGRRARARPRDRGPGSRPCRWRRWPGSRSIA